MPLLFVFTGLVFTDRCVASPDYSLDILYDLHLYSVSDGDIKGMASGFRRVRGSMEYSAEVGLSAELSIDVDEKKNKLGVKDAFFVKEMPSLGEVKVGRFKEPGGLDQDLSLKSQFFMERSLSNQVFGYGRSNGIGIEKRWGHIKGERSTTASLGGYVFSETDSNSGGGSFHSYSVRATWLAYKDQAGRLLHLGGLWSEHDMQMQSVRLSQAISPEVIGGRAIKSTRNESEHLKNASIDLAWRSNRWLWQGEYYFQRQEAGLSGYLDYSGYYGLVNFTIVGPPRDYSGTFRLGSKKKSIIEISLRRSVVDFRQRGVGDIAAVNSLALNIYPGSGVRFSLQVETGGLQEYEDGVLQDVNEASISTRMQVLLN